MRVFETRMATGRENFACQDSSVSQFFILIISHGEKIAMEMCLWEDKLKGKNSSLPLAVRISKSRVLKLPSEKLILQTVQTVCKMKIRLT